MNFLGNIASLPLYLGTSKVKSPFTLILGDIILTDFGTFLPGN